VVVSLFQFGQKQPPGFALPSKREMVRARWQRARQLRCRTRAAAIRLQVLRLRDVPSACSWMQQGAASSQPRHMAKDEDRRILRAMTLDPAVQHTRRAVESTIIRRREPCIRPYPQRQSDRTHAPVRPSMDPRQENRPGQFHSADGKWLNVSCPSPCCVRLISALCGVGWVDGLLPVRCRLAALP
jgi:hypothetical protein